MQPRFRIQKKSMLCEKSSVYGKATIPKLSCYVTDNCHCKTYNCEIPEMGLQPLPQAGLRAYRTGCVGHTDMNRFF